MSPRDFLTVVDQRGAEYRHEPVLLDQVADWLTLPDGGVFVDFTVGGGGHLARIAELSAEGTELYGFDRDEAALAATRSRFDKLKNSNANVTLQLRELFHAPFAGCASVLRMRNIERIHGALFDLGVSSMQIDTPSRGFSFQADGPLDMRMDQTGSASAARLVNNSTVEELTKIIFEFGEERRARRAAQALVKARQEGPLETVGQVRRALEQELGSANLTKTLARVFQALRIAVNDELAQLREALPQVVDMLAPGARLAIISYHSLEDRIVKRFFASRIGACVCPPRTPVCVCGAHADLRILTKKPITPDQKEISANPRARSAKMRVAEKLPLMQEQSV